MEKTSDNPKLSFRKKYKTIIITAGITLLLIVLILGALLFGFLKYYVGGSSINRRAIDAPLRSILWESPSPLTGRLNSIRNNRDASISSDGRMIVLAHEYAKNNFDLYVSRCVDDKWSQQVPIKEINSPYNEKGPEISNDERFLFFSSDRPGGFGGYDIWYSYYDGNRWSRPINMGNLINTASNERDPAISPDSKTFFFSSDRPFSNEDAKEGKNDYDLYMALAPQIAKKAKEVIPKPPKFKNPENVVSINSSYDEGKAVLTPRGNTIYFSSNRPGGIGGYDLYRSYFVKNKFMPPVNFGTPINSAFDEINPTMTLEGFGIYFSSNRKSRNPNDYQVFRSTSREVLMKFDYAMLVKMILSFFGIILGILFVYLLLKILLSDTRMKLIWKCLLAAVIIHLIVIILCAFWMLGSDIANELKPAPKEMTINVNNLARESIAMAIRESIASLPTVQTTSVVEKLPIPAQKPVINKSTPTKQSTVPKTTVTPVSMKMVQDVSGEPPKGDEPLPVLKPFQAGANIKMETPGEVQGIATPTDGKANDGIPKPYSKLDIPKVEMDSLPVTMKIVQIEDPNQETIDKNNIAPPSVERALKQSNRVIDTPAGRDSTNEILPTASAVPIKGVPGNFGFPLFDVGLKMEENKVKEMQKSPELTILLKDPNITKALKLTMQNDKIAEQKLEDLIKGYIKKNKLKFNSFEIVRFLIAENKLKPVGNLVYGNMMRLNIPADSELEVPEKYNR